MIASYSQFINESQEEVLDTKEKIAAWLDSNEIMNYTINDDLTVDVNGVVNLTGSKFDKIPVKFGKVTGYFSCDNCKNLTSLEGCPTSVGGSFYCSNCTSLTSLKGCPESVGGEFWCVGCTKLSSYEGCPKLVGSGFYCGDTIFFKLDKILDKDKLLEIFGGQKPASKENQELLVELALDKNIEWNLIEPWIDKQIIEKYKTTSTLNKLGF